MKRFLRHLAAISIAGVIFLALVVLVILTGNYIMKRSVASQDTVAIPDLTGMDFDHAKALLTRLDLELDLIEYEHNDLPAGSIINQTPTAGRTIYKGRMIMVNVSRGPKSIVIPTMTGFAYNNLDEIFRTHDLKLGEVRQRYSDDIPAGFVINTVPAFGTTIMAGNPIDVIISIGRDPLSPAPRRPNPDSAPTN